MESSVKVSLFTTTHLNEPLHNICIHLILMLLRILVLGCHCLSWDKCLIVCAVSHQILMSVCCPLHAAREHVQTQRVPSHVSSVSPVSESLRMDNSVTVRLLVVFLQECGLLYLSTFAQVSVVSSFIQTCRALPPNLTESRFRVTVPGECSPCSQLAQVLCKQHQVWQLQARVPSSEIKIPKYTS